MISTSSVYLSIYNLIPLAQEMNGRIMNQEVFKAHPSEDGDKRKSSNSKDGKQNGAELIRALYKVDEERVGADLVVSLN